MFRYGKCTDKSCNFSHAPCTAGDDCPYRFCGYHKAPHNKTWLNYFKLWDVESRVAHGVYVDFARLYNEIYGFETVGNDIRKAYETASDIKEFSKAIDEISDRVNFTHKYMIENKYPIKFTKPQIAIKYLKEKVIVDGDEKFKTNMSLFFEILDNEIAIAKDFYNQCVKIDVEVDSCADYNVEFPELVSIKN
jgi:hypothetical protein